MRTRALKILLLLIASFDQQSFSQLPGVPQQTAERQAESSDDPLDRSTPRGTVIGFIKAVGQDDYDTALGYLDTNQKGDLGRKLSMELKTVLDQEASIEINELSRRPDGESAVSAHPNRYLAGVITSSSKKVEIWLDRVKRSDDPPIWLFSRETLKQGRKRHKHV